MTNRFRRVLAVLGVLVLALALGSTQSEAKSRTFDRQKSWTGHLQSVDVSFRHRYLDVRIRMDQARNYDYWAVRLHTVPNARRSHEGFLLAVFEGRTGMQAVSPNESTVRTVRCPGIHTRVMKRGLTMRVPARCITNHYAHPTGIAKGVQTQVFVTDRRNGTASSEGDVTASIGPDADGRTYLRTVYRS